MTNKVIYILEVNFNVMR